MLDLPSVAHLPLPRSSVHLCNLPHILFLLYTLLSTQPLLLRSTPSPPVKMMRPAVKGGKVRGEEMRSLADFIVPSPQMPPPCPTLCLLPAASLGLPWSRPAIAVPRLALDARRARAVATKASSSSSPDSSFGSRMEDSVKKTLADNPVIIYSKSWCSTADAGIFRSLRYGRVLALSGRPTASRPPDPSDEAQSEFHRQISPTAKVGEVSSSPVEVVNTNKRLTEIDAIIVTQSGFAVFDAEGRCTGVVLKKDKAKALLPTI